MKIKEVKLETVCGIKSSLPENTGVEFAFIGRSNVGKSSLINTILNRKSLARTSSQPGKTQTINYYKINDDFYLVDLPGYGYAKVSKEMKDKWLRMTDNYFVTSKMLRVVFQLIDIRHTPSALDVSMYNRLCEIGFSPIIIATKADKIKKAQLKKHISCIEKTLNTISGTPIIPFSSFNGEGKEEILEYIEEYNALFSEENMNEE
ncbi:MAG: YihA family ribosome biogenesis GTP-binding protein [Lachnospiraceae bacterium]|nr:YihA family ribosome biogenesis GTP-binding protein [Lachnospiraceae bacterium]